MKLRNFALHRQRSWHGMLRLNIRTIPLAFAIFCIVISSFNVVGAEVTASLQQATDGEATDPQQQKTYGSLDPADDAASDDNDALDDFAAQEPGGAVQTADENESPMQDAQEPAAFGGEQDDDSTQMRQAVSATPSRSALATQRAVREARQRHQLMQQFMHNFANNMRYAVLSDSKGDIPEAERQAMMAKIRKQQGGMVGVDDASSSSADVPNLGAGEEVPWPPRWSSDRAAPMRGTLLNTRASEPNVHPQPPRMLNAPRHHRHHAAASAQIADAEVPTEINSDLQGSTEQVARDAGRLRRKHPHSRHHLHKLFSSKDRAERSGSSVRPGTKFGCAVAALMSACLSAYLAGS
eukprot:TRINITY_DN1567_c1_g1_i2.p1 TRINITY_DN1567_c1_g1~~TRINITY_DN1567_c1_g1_i2.p1  ORF type:complete len:352 (+),score=51.83 TRINITY_DN1567_c1_g1_i2:43-1098(+)